jgi:hypothetical protein
MRSSEQVSLPIAEEKFSSSDEQVMRRTVEQALQDLRIDIIETRDGSDKTASLATRRFQFLLMGM